MENERRSSVSYSSSGVEISVERCFRIYLAAQHAFFSVFEDAFERLANAGGASEMLNSVSQQRLEARLTSAIDNLCDSISSQPEMANLDISSVDRSRYIRTLNPHFAKIQTAEQTLAERNIPDGVLASMWRGAANALTDPTAATAGMVIPGIGNILGGLWSSFQLGKKDDEAINTFRAAIEAFRGQLKEVFTGCYQDISEAATRQGVRFSASGREISETLEKLDAMADAIESADSEEDLKRLVGEIERFLQKYPFSGKAHSIYAFGLLGLERCEQADQEAYTAYSIDNDNHLAIVVMLLARIAMERWEDASQTAMCAIACCQSNPELCEPIANALKRIPCPQMFSDSIAFVASSLQKSSNPVGCLLEARLHGAQDQSDQCQSMLSRFLVEAPLDVSEAMFLRNDPILSEVVNASFQGVLAGPLNHMSVARTVLAGCESLWFGSIPAPKREAAVESFVKLRSGEHLICYCDTTLFGGGKDGFALTDSRILWHELWKDPVAIRYSDIEDFEIAPVGGELKLLSLVTSSGTRETYSEAPPRTAIGIFNYLILVTAAAIHTADAS